MRVLIYCRVSTDDQNVDQQAEVCREYCKDKGYEIAWTIKDKESGRKPLLERERFLKILRDEYNFSYDAVLVYNLDRLTRNWDDVTKIERYFRENWDRVKLMSISNLIDLGNASGRLMFRIFFATACFQPEDMYEKTMIGVARAKKEGKYKGGKKGRSWAK